MTSRIILRGCRRLSTTFISTHSSPVTKLHHLQPPPSPPPPQKPFTTHPSPFLPPPLSSTPIKTLIRHFSSTSTSASSTTATSSAADPHSTTSAGEKMKHQEIEGPTVEKDLSPLANETREVTNSLLKIMYNVSTFFALLGLSHLALGAYSYYTITSASGSGSGSGSALSLMISAMAFGFPFAMAFMVRQSLKSMHFFQKMEKIGRLQLLTSSMQIFKHLRVLFVRVRALSVLCLAGLSFSFLYSVSSSL